VAQQSSDGPAVRTATLPDGVPLHARPAGNLVRAAAGYPASIALLANGKRADAKSILQVLALGATGGSEVTVEVTGEDAEATADAVAGLLAGLSG
jgi:phosphotransferase system HPr (HPr) family protein